MGSRHDAAQVQSLVQSPQHAKSNVKRQAVWCATSQVLQHEMQRMIQGATDQAAERTRELVERVVTALADSSTAVQSQLDKLDRSTVLALSLEELSEVRALVQPSMPFCENILTL